MTNWAMVVSAFRQRAIVRRAKRRGAKGAELDAVYWAATYDARNQCTDIDKPDRLVEDAFKRYMKAKGHR